MTHLLIIIMLMAPVRTVGVNCKGKNCRKPKATHEVQRSRYKRGDRRGNKNAKYRLKRRRKSGGTYGQKPTRIKRRSGNIKRTETPKRIQAPKTTPAPKRRTLSQERRRARDLMLLQWTTSIMLSDPEYGEAYRRILDKQIRKKNKGSKKTPGSR